MDDGWMCGWWMDELCFKQLFDTFVTDRFSFEVLDMESFVISLSPACLISAQIPDGFCSFKPEYNRHLHPNNEHLIASLSQSFTSLKQTAPLNYAPCLLSLTDSGLITSLELNHLCFTWKLVMTRWCSLGHVLTWCNGAKITESLQPNVCRREKTRSSPHAFLSKHH